MLKRGQGALGNKMQRRYFVLTTGHALHYYQQQGAADGKATGTPLLRFVRSYVPKPRTTRLLTSRKEGRQQAAMECERERVLRTAEHRGTIDLSEAMSVERSPNAPAECTFTIRQKARDWVLDAGDPGTLDAWLVALNAAVAAAAAAQHAERLRLLREDETVGVLKGKGRVPSLGEPLASSVGRPMVHQERRTHDSADDIEWDVARRETRLKHCSNELLLAELKHRNIRLHEHITAELVQARYKLGRLLGQGASAPVYHAVHRRSQLEVAVKVIKKDDDMNDDASMATELEILKSVHHRYILNCLELFETPQCIWVVMELIKGGELLEVLIEGGVYTERDASRAMKQAFLAVSYLHSQGIVHRDLKLSNLLLTEKRRSSDLKLCDFGLSAQIPRSALDWGDKEAVKAYAGLTQKWGTPQYFAPELCRKAYGPQVDLWALGVVLFQLLVGRLPFHAPSNEEIFKQIERSPNHLKKLFALAEWKSVSASARDLVASLLHPDPRCRPNADEALLHEWVALKGEVGGSGQLKDAQEALKERRARHRLAAMWHVFDVINAIDEPGTRRLPPVLMQSAAEALMASSADDGQQPRARTQSATDKLEELQGLFRLCDTDGSGAIDEEEISALFGRLGYVPDTERLRSLIREVDTNANGELEFDEFCAFLRLAKQPGKGLGLTEGVHETLQSLADKEGYMSTEGLAEVLVMLTEKGGQPISASEIADVIAIAEDAERAGRARTATVAEAVMMPRDVRKQRATEILSRRSTQRGSSFQALSSKISEAPGVLLHKVSETSDDRSNHSGRPAHAGATRKASMRNRLSVSRPWQSAKLRIASLKLFREHNGSSAKVAGASSASAKLKLDASSWSAVKTQGAKSEVHKVYSSRM